MPLSLVQLDALLLKPANPDLEESSNRPPVWRHTTVKVRPVITVTYEGKVQILWSVNIALAARAKKILDEQHITEVPTRANPSGQSMHLQGCNDMLYRVGTWIA